MTYAKKTILLLLMSLATCFAAAAQDAKAKFTLPHEAVWGKTILPAGEYLVSLEFGAIPKAFVNSESGSRVAFVAIPEITESTTSCGTSSLTLMRNGGAWSVRSVCFAGAQLAVYFMAEPGETTLAALPQHVESVSGAR